MFCEKAHSLIKEVNRVGNNLPPYNPNLVGEVQREIDLLLQAAISEANTTLPENNGASGGNSHLMNTVQVRHAAIQRNVRCLLAYMYNRLRCVRLMRWEFGTVLPPDIKANLSQSESAWFSTYSRMLSKYMRSVNKSRGGVNLMLDLKPPKALCIEIRCLFDFGTYELKDGTVIHLKKDSRHFLPRSETEALIRQGICEHIIS